MNFVNIKLNFFTKLSHLQITLVILHQNRGNQEQIITLLFDNTTFLKDQLHQEDKVGESLNNQFSQQNIYLFQKRNTDIRRYKMLLYKTKRYLQRKILLKVPR